MPTYEYRCKKCDQIFEFVQSFDDPPKKSRRGCPEGGSCQLKKVYGSVGISFKGGGFYKNDSKGGSSKPSSESSSSASESSSSDSKSSDSKSSDTKSSDSKSSDTKSSSSSGSSDSAA
ncbi:MAG: zinc ribbon domain-containing protein [Actinomycetia bacterium]|nr:zinc ribbon domain-containing protein [Actinomycetes bacterium]